MQMGAGAGASDGCLQRGGSTSCSPDASILSLRYNDCVIIIYFDLIPAFRGRDYCRCRFFAHTVTLRFRRNTFWSLVFWT